MQQQDGSLFLVIYEGEHTCNSTSGATNEVVQERSLSSSGRARSEPDKYEQFLIHFGEMDTVCENAINGGQRCESLQASLIMLDELGDPTIFDSFSESIAHHFDNDVINCPG